MKLQPVPGEQKYAVAIQDGSGLWLTLWVRCSRKGEIFIMLPRGDRDWDAHASYHLDGTLHQKSYGHVVGSWQRQPLTATFRGRESVGKFMGHGKSNGAICDPGAFTDVIVVQPGLLVGTRGYVEIDLLEPGRQPRALSPEEIVQRVFPRGDRPSIVITIGR